MLEKNDRALNNGQSIDTSNIGHIAQKKDQHNKNTAQKTQMMRNTTSTKRYGGEPWRSQRV